MQLGKIIRYFPWVLFQKWAAGFLLALIGFLAALVLGIRTYIPEESRSNIELFVILLALGFYAIALWLQFRSMIPLAIIARKSRSLATGEEIDGGERWEPNPYEEDADNEWSDIEENLNRVQFALRENQEKLSRERQGIQTLVHSSGDPILAVDKDGYSVFFNSRLESLVGREKLSQKHVRVSEIFREPSILDAFQKVLKDGTSERLSVQLVPESENLERFYSVNIVPLIKQANGDVYGAMGIFHDITELKRTEILKIDFIANVSHELRTPLTSVQGYVQIIEEDLKAGRTQDIQPQLAIISSNVKRLTSLVSDLLDLSTLETGGDLNISAIEVDEVTESALQQIENLRKQKNISIETKYEVGTFNADRKRIEQVLINLIQNAVKYIPEGRKVWVSWESGEKSEVILRVKDNGNGISQEHLPRIFERFYRVDAARSKSLGGTGLGLAIVKHIVQRHGGSINVKSTVGQGTEFICRFS